MFTGIIQAVGKVAALQRRGVDYRLQIATGRLDMADVRLGDSIAVSGVCLTVTALSDAHFWADVSAETLANSRLDELVAGSPVNLEKALQLASRLGGHLVSGHVDGVGVVLERQTEGRAERFSIQAPEGLSRYIAARGSITVDGVSLTVNDVDDNVFRLNIVPHTLQETTLASLQAGQRVNLEVDLVARYLERLLQNGSGSRAADGISMDFLARHGFLS